MRAYNRLTIQLLCRPKALKTCSPGNNGLVIRTSPFNFPPRACRGPTTIGRDNYLLQLHIDGIDHRTVQADRGT